MPVSAAFWPDLSCPAAAVGSAATAPARPPAAEPARPEPADCSGREARGATFAAPVAPARAGPETRLAGAAEDALATGAETRTRYAAGGAVGRAGTGQPASVAAGTVDELTDMSAPRAGDGCVVPAR